MLQGAAGHGSRVLVVCQPDVTEALLAALRMSVFGCGREQALSWAEMWLPRFPGQPPSPFRQSVSPPSLSAQACPGASWVRRLEHGLMFRGSSQLNDVPLLAAGNVGEGAHGATECHACVHHASRGQQPACGHVGKGVCWPGGEVGRLSVQGDLRRADGPGPAGSLARRPVHLEGEATRSSEVYHWCSNTRGMPCNFSSIERSKERCKIITCFGHAQWRLFPRDGSRIA